MAHGATWRDPVFRVPDISPFNITPPEENSLLNRGCPKLWLSFGIYPKHVLSKTTHLAFVQESRPLGEWQLPSMCSVDPWLGVSCGGFKPGTDLALRRDVAGD